MAALFCAVLPVAQGAGLGKLTLISALGQPLNAEVEIVSLRPGEEGLSARLASPEAFAKAWGFSHVVRPGTADKLVLWEASTAGSSAFAAGSDAEVAALLAEKLGSR